MTKIGKTIIKWIPYKIYERFPFSAPYSYQASGRKSFNSEKLYILNDTQMNLVTNRTTSDITSNTMWMFMMIAIGASFLVVVTGLCAWCQIVRPFKHRNSSYEVRQPVERNSSTAPFDLKINIKIENQETLPTM
ncbi:unnamed protein product [Phyllotreta striolata]|uniref:Uncharacterized protein n=1 Tax=Phyllotreta striolata TaxID=444603 RepID=A0A9N9TL23_PHYSR|nr:unnamed protein product [Phyllotreta striolata]